MERFWLNNFNSLFNRNNLLNIIPYSHIDLNSKLNAIFRLSIYFSIIMFVIKKDYKYLSIIVIVGILTIIIYRMSPKNMETNIQVKNTLKDSNYNEESEGCKIPTLKNPFMNVMPEDYGNLGRPGDLRKACNSYDNPLIRSMEEEYFNVGLYRDQTDIFNKNNSQREFYTMPVNSIVNDTVKFAEWCYKTPPICKEGNGFQCASDIHSNTLGVRGGSATSGASSH